MNLTRMKKSDCLLHFKIAFSTPLYGQVCPSLQWSMVTKVVVEKTIMLKLRRYWENKLFSDSQYRRAYVRVS